MDGLAVGGKCFRNSTEAAAAACSSVQGVTGAGVVSCTAPTVDASGLVSYSLSVEGSASASSRQASMQLQPCEPRDFAFYAPVLGVWFVALVTVLALRMVYTQTFGRSNV